MKKTLILSIFLLLTIKSFGKSEPFRNYNFEKGGYYLLGTISNFENKSIKDSLWNFYIDDLETLNQTKKNWKFQKSEGNFASDYHYQIFLCYKGKILESFFVNLKCNEIYYKQKHYKFDPNLLRQFYGKDKLPQIIKHQFKTIEEARNLRSEILKDSNLITTNNPKWTVFEGEFVIDYTDGKSLKMYKLKNIKKNLKKIETDIKNKYPNEKFEISENGGSKNSVIILIKCNKSLYDKFDIYDGNSIFEIMKWTEYELSLVSYWKTNFKFNNGKIIKN